MSLVYRIKEKCNEKGTSIKALEREIGLGNGTISRWDSNTPSYDKVIKVADFLQVSFYWLIFGKESAELSPEEQELVECYRAANDQGKRAVMTMARLQKQELESSISPTGLTGTGKL